MNERLIGKISGKLEELSDEAGRQLLDYIEFLRSKYNRSSRDRTVLERLADNIEGTLGVAGPAQVIDTAESVVRGVAAAGRAVVDGLQRTGKSAEAEPGSSDDTEGPAENGEQKVPEEDTEAPASS